MTIVERRESRVESQKSRVAPRAASALQPRPRRAHVGEFLRNSHETSAHVGQCLRHWHETSRDRTNERSLLAQNKTTTLSPLAPHSSPLAPRSSRPPRAGVTLVELLVTMLIITILAGLILGVAAVAGETARKAQTRVTIQRLHKLMMEHYDTFKTRRVSVRPAVLAGINAKATWTAGQKRQAIAAARLYALRELMAMEIPDRWSDITLSDNGSIRAPYFLDVDTSRSPNARTPLSSVYLRRYQQIAASAGSTALLQNQSAECLYLVITLATGDGEARSQFSEGDIGDTDGDGAPEFLDSWGQPIAFLRWAPGFDSQIQRDANTLTDESIWMGAALDDHDPFDMYRVDAKAFRLIPLIYSAGGDNSYGLWTVDEYNALRGETNINAPSNPDSWAPDKFKPVPYAQIEGINGEGQLYLGTAYPDRSSTDNIHNHLLELR